MSLAEIPSVYRSAHPGQTLLERPLAEVLAALGSSEAGLSEAEAERRLQEVGLNDNAAARPAGVLRQTLRRIASPLVLLLLAASVLSAVLGDRANAGIIFAIICVSLALESFQTRRSQRAAERLRAQVAVTATVLREGAWSERPRRGIVPGDVVRLGAGDLVPADAWLLSAKDLHLQQAALTGESLPVEKTASSSSPSALDANQPSALFAGTSVVSGSGVALVVATGPRTTFGEVVAQLSTRRPPSAFEQSSARFGTFILHTVLVLVLFVFASAAFLHRDPLQSFLFAVALAVGLTPEFLPMITTVTLSRGALRMAKQRVIVKSLAAIEDLGSMDVLCSDKTGTLTTGVMEFAQSVDASGKSDSSVLALAFVNSAFESGISNPLDVAIRHSATSAGLGAAGAVKLDEVPFDFERRCVTVVVERAGVRQLVTKGAPESVLSRCTELRWEGAVVPLDEGNLALCQARLTDLGAEGFRILAVATKTAAVQAAYGVADECALTLEGFLTFADPPVEGVAETLLALQGDGVSIKVLSGDAESVVRHVCARVGLDTTHILCGDEVDRLTDSALSEVANRTSVFARLTPMQKTRLVRTLRLRGHVVGYLGDGINDAPSLRAAHVGISVANAVDVARDAADLVLLEAGLSVLHAGILEGRRAYGNVMKYLLMGTSSNFGNMFSMAGATLVLPFLPMLPQQILLNNLFYDLAQLTIPTDHVDPEVLRKPRVWRIDVVRRFMWFVGPVSSLYDFLTFWVLLHFFHAPEALFHTGWFVESLATQTLVIFVIRTGRNPFRSRPSWPLTATVGVTVLGALVLPLTPLAGLLGFVPLPLGFFGFLLAASVTYLALVEGIKRVALRGQWT